MARMTYERAIRDSAEWSFETARFFVGFYADAEDMDPADSFGRDDDIEFAREDIAGHWFSAAVRVFLKSDSPYDWKEVGADHLGGCSYNSIEEFYTSHRNPDPANRNTLANKDKGIVICHYFPDMVRIAIAEARKELARMHEVASTMRAA